MAAVIDAVNVHKFSALVSIVHGTPLQAVVKNYVSQSTRKNKGRARIGSGGGKFTKKYPAEPARKNDLHITLLNNH